MSHVNVKRMMKRIGVLVALLALAFPAFATATIVINRGMFGVNLGATMKQARKKLGVPMLVRRSGGEIEWYYVRRKLLLRFRGTNPLLHTLYTESRVERTARGVGVGSTKRDVTRAYPGVICVKTVGQPGQDCGVFSPDRKRVTDFQIAVNGRVRFVAILTAPFD